MPRLLMMGLFTTLFSLFIGCNDSSSTIGVPVGRMPDRQLGLGVTEGSIGYELSFAAARNAGIQFVELPQQWDEVELASGSYESPFAAMANEVYPQLDTSIVLSMNPIDTATSRVPKQLLGFAWDSAERIEAFTKWFDWTKSQMPDAHILAVSVGNEVDVYFESHPEEIAAYVNFFEQIARHIRKRLPQATVGCKMTFQGRTGKLKQSVALIDSHADATMLTYYPLDEQFHVRNPREVTRDFEVIVSLSEKPIYLLETGYPSGSACQSSDAKQAAFVDTLFEVWDQHLDRVPVVNFVWTCDLPKTQVDSMVQYYGVQEPAFREYLATLGFRKSNGINKPAFDRIRQNVKRRAGK